VLVVVAQGRQRNLRFTRLAVAQDDQSCRWDPLGQDFIAQNEGGKGKQSRVKRSEDGFAGGGQMLFQDLWLR